ncbi:MAG TPA: type II toxin-antitoxin system prevent-host-death family antitoxin [Gemmatimonadaceae bacterium]|nr:type II toxin-antitoxin system prevent-host-death family antitoxin [Gemmatimonadaceae bacterium]
MRNTYSLYEAKARLSGIIRQVREGHSVIVTLHGKPVVEIRAVATGDEGLGGRMRELEERGILVRDGPKRPVLRAVARRPGALKRFLDDRE